MKKKIISMLAASAMLLAMLTACGSSGDTSTGTDAVQDAGSAQAAQTKDSTEKTDASDSEGTLAKYDVKIKGAQLCEDYEGNPAIIITYSWTNGSDETTSPMGSMMGEAFQDGVQIETAIVDFEYKDSMTDVRPGTTIDVEVIYEMTSQSKVEFEISALEDMFLDPVPKCTMEFDPATLESR